MESTFITEMRVSESYLLAEATEIHNGFKLSLKFDYLFPLRFNKYTEQRISIHHQNNLAFYKKIFTNVSN